MGYYIHDLEYYLPERVIDNNFLSTECGIDSSFLENKVGIQKRHVAGINESTSEMAFNAASKLLARNNCEIDLLLLCTQNPDYRLPTTACIVHKKLNLSDRCIAFDINLGCSGFVYALPIAGNFIDLGTAKNALLIMVDQYSKAIDYKDKNTAALFGDASSAILLKKCDDGLGVIDFDLRTDGSGFKSLIMYNSGVVIDEDKNKFIYMDGRDIFKFTINKVPQSISAILERNNLHKKDIKYFILHQANKYILDEIKKKMEVEDEQFVIDMALYGNTVSSTIPIAYKNLLDSGKIKPGDKVVFCGFGVGLSWGAIIYKSL